MLERSGWHWSEINSTGAEFVAKANELHFLLLRLVGLSELIGGENVLGIWPMRYSIPALDLGAFKGEPKVGPHGGYLHH